MLKTGIKLYTTTLLLSIELVVAYSTTAQEVVRWLHHFPGTPIELLPKLKCWHDLLGCDCAKYQQKD